MSKIIVMYEEMMESLRLIDLIKVKLQKLSHHEVYSRLTSRVNINCFMSYHIFAVWDGMKLLKSLQHQMGIALQEQLAACPSEMKKLIEKIVFAEESDLYPYGQPNEYFALYLQAISEIGVDEDCLWSFLEAQDNLHSLKPGIRELVESNLEIVKTGTMEELVATFFLGREQLTAQIFTSIIKVLQQEGEECPILMGYTERLNQSNNQKYPIIALKLLDCICSNESDKIVALQAGLEALNLRERLWDYALAEITETI